MELKQELEDWLKSLSQSEKGKAFICNLVYEIRHKNVDLEKLKEFFTSIASSWNSEENLEEKQTAAENLCKKVAINYYLLGPKVKKSIPKVQCSRIMKAIDLYSHNIDKTKFPLEFSNPKDEEINYLLKKLPTSAKGELKGGKPFAWVTQSSVLEVVYASEPEERKASVVRDLLGLEIDDNQALIEIQYPKDKNEYQYSTATNIKFKSFTLLAPTVFDAGPSSVYRSNRALGGWGCTVNLRTMKKGLPEAIHKPILFKGTFKVSFIGRTIKIDVVNKKTDFLKYFPCPWNGKLIMEILKLVD